MTALAHTRHSGPTDARYLIVHEIAGQTPAIYRLEDIFAMRSEKVSDVCSAVAYDEDAWLDVVLDSLADEVFGP